MYPVSQHPLKYILKTLWLVLPLNPVSQAATLDAVPQEAMHFGVPSLKSSNFFEIGWDRQCHLDGAS